MVSDYGEGTRNRQPLHGDRDPWSQRAAAEYERLRRQRIKEQRAWSLILWASVTLCLSFWLTAINVARYLYPELVTDDPWMEAGPIALGMTTLLSALACLRAILVFIGWTDEVARQVNLTKLHDSLWRTAEARHRFEAAVRAQGATVTYRYGNVEDGFSELLSNPPKNP
jgi:hypothetical protein